LAAAAIPAAWAYGIVSGDTVRNLLTLAFVSAVVVETLRRRDRRFGERFNALLGPLLKPHERESPTGATLLAFSALLDVLVLPGPAARAALWAGAAGDVAAALGGTAWPWRSSPTGKTAVGSLACALVTALGAAWLVPTGWGVAAALGVVAAAAEWPSRWGDDNLRVTAATGLAAWFLGVS
jgi:dolichol kinase